MLGILSEIDLEEVAEVVQSKFLKRLIGVSVL